jgi:Ca-activated chloride channel family protein
MAQSYARADRAITGAAGPLDGAQGMGTLEEMESLACASPSYDEPAPAPTASTDPVTTLLARQSSSGMWEEPGRDPIEVSIDALLVLVRLGISTSHPVHGAQTKKAVDALLAALAAAPKLDPKLAELALASLWLLSTGRRTREAIKVATGRWPGLEALAAVLGRDDDVRAHVERIAPMC